GYTSFQGLTWLRQQGLALHPDIVIAGFGFNDASPGPDVEEQIAAERRHAWLLRIDDALTAGSLAWSWLRTRGAPAQPGGTLRVTPQRYAEHMADIVDLSRAAGAQVVLLSFLPEWGDGATGGNGVPYIA